MAISNHERVGRALTLLREGLYPFMEREMRSSYGNRWLSAASACLPDHYLARREVKEVLEEDVSALLIVLWEQWNNVFRHTLGRSERSMVNELRDTRNDWAHNGKLSTDDAYRALDTVGRLLLAISAPEAQQVERQKQELLRLRFEEQARRESRRVAIAPTEGQPMTGLKPWREIMTPHPDVASGRYQQAEFAADLWQVYKDEGSDEYRLPTEFFRRTYLTEGLKQLLVGGLRRLSGQGGDPVIELQTNFGGGKTHAMLALYHLCLGVPVQELPGLEPILQEAGVEKLPDDVNTAVLVGNKISPGQVHCKSDGTEVHTLWGELAWQLGGREGYEMLREADETATNPGDTLKDLFNRYAPVLILMDEWVAYARQLHEQSDLPAGSFDTHFTFAQTLSESAKNARQTFLVVSIPASDIEIGGERGKDALERLKNAIGRVESPWRPASAQESFEIVRRRLFETTSDPSLFVQRDTTIRAFCQMYRGQGQEFPPECKEGEYERRMREAYPIHPELFDRLYEDWSSLDKFQRTRGVLRLMAKVIHCLWERNDQSLMIMPAHVPMDDSQIQSELTRYLEDNWIPVMDKDVDGPNSLPLALDRDNPNLGRYSACRRVTRSIYMGSAPTLRAANRGVEDRRIKLACVQPGETVATFGDALRRLTDQATYLYIDGTRYWVSTQPNVNRTAQERANQVLEDGYPVQQEVIKRLKEQQRGRGAFSAVHVAPESTADIPDDPSLGVRLVVLSPEYGHSRGESPARQWIEEALNQKGNSPRYYKNTLVFLAADKGNLDNLYKTAAQYLAWRSIIEDKDALNLDAFQDKQAKTKLEQSNGDVDNRLREAYQWLLIPTQLEPQGGLEWKENRLQGQAALFERASKKAIDEGDLLENYGAANLRLDLDQLLWRDRHHIDLKQLWEYLTQYLYLPRFKDRDVLLDTVRSGVASTIWADHFAYAEGFDQERGKYVGLQAGTGTHPSISPQSLLVKPAIAQKQWDDEKAQTAPKVQPEPGTAGAGKREQRRVSEKAADFVVAEGVSPESMAEAAVLRRFYGNVDLDAMRVNRDVSAIANEIIQHLTALQGARVKITLEIQAEIPEGVPDDVVRTVTENCRTLKFNTQSFERE
ncbi:Swt1 family HEPN domain-containing protein [Roseofilum sp. BLCC_M154]|uniref:Swt1 family HEPN domain-containing protein n=1 Tax=Roseofilum acuticapitatum BLCC-M154 TaxID=3022444 RepID=A0ABT7ANF8_9CYAN|nr:Swt1 family HEPN domain-containing protein [Roseofilum acuticapitatum]MDJ1168434.1 Swt1 family HEPN domain-containing protein [Roseofilum acuticapitatum BLCC-M154]